MKDYKLETIEWTQYWSEFAPDEKTPRVLLIGDSISVGYRHIVEGMLGGEYHISSMATSKAVDNPWFMDEVRLLHKQECDYEIVHVNNGAHGGHLDADAYEKYSDKLICALKEEFPSAKFVLALTTPVMKKDDLAAFNPEGNARVKERNERALALAEKHGIRVIDDLYSAALSEPSLHGPDGLHFTEHGYEVLAKSVVESIQKAAK